MPLPKKIAARQPSTIVAVIPSISGSTGSNPNKKSYLVGLDTLRAIAALSVCLFHFTGGMLPKLVVPELESIFSQGYLGVDIFFVISGFIIPYSLIGKNHRISGFFSYIKKRVLRINPPAYASILIVLCQGLFIDRVINHNLNYTGNLSWGQLIHNFLFTIPFTHYKWINGVFWTLAIEFQFYLFIGVLFRFLFEKGLIWFLALYVFAILMQYIPLAESENFFRYASLFALGGLALMWQQRRIGAWLYIASLCFFGAIAYFQLGNYAALVGVSTAVALNAIKASIAGFTFLGKISYSLYLLHAIIGTSAEFILVKIWPPNSSLEKLLLTAVCLGLSIAGSYIFYRLVEQPFMRMAAQNRR
jgi:peptidoglycan/LPS O-acetylase OafA/YrhL